MTYITVLYGLLISDKDFDNLYDEIDKVFDYHYSDNKKDVLIGYPLTEPYSEKDYPPKQFSTVKPIGKNMFSNLQKFCKTHKIKHKKSDIKMYATENHISEGNSW